MTCEDHWTRALAASAVAQSEGFSETAKAFAELAMQAMEAEGHKQFSCRHESQNLAMRGEDLSSAPPKSLS